MEHEFKFFTPTELPIVGERFSQVKCNGNEESIFTNAEVIAYFPPEENRGAYIIIKANLSSRMIWEVYIHENILHTWRFKY